MECVTTMPRPKKKPNYNPSQVVQMSAVADAFGFYDDKVDEICPGLNVVAAEFGITALKAKKLLITAGVYSTALSRQVAELAVAGYKIDQIIEFTGLSQASVHSYLPYTKIPYKLEELSVNVEGIQRYQGRKKRCEEFCPGYKQMSEAEQEDGLWKLLIFLQNCVFYTTHGLKFTYKICGGERFVNQKSKSITQITVFMAYNRAMELIELNGIVSSPKQLGTFGASYLYPVFVRIGVIGNRSD